MLKRITLALSAIFEKPFPEGTVVDGRYKIQSLLGSGGYGHSYLALDQVSCRQLVIKTLRLHKRVRSSGRKSFAREIQFMKEISHPGLPAYFESGNHQGIPYYTMEFIDGENFEQLIFQFGRTFSEKETFAVAANILDVLGYLHSNGIVHRDVRIPNVILSQESIVLLDLGLAVRPVDSPVKRRLSHNLLRRGKNVQADFYGLGHFILFLLYSSYTAEEGQKEKSWEEELAISPEAKKIIRRLLKIDSEYRSCREIKEDINLLILKGEKAYVIV
jgi:serine/threonine protein kinase, bacterial